MENWLRIGGAVIIGIIALWIILAIVEFIIGVVMWLVQIAVMLTVLAVLIYGAYVLLSRMGGGSSSKSKSRERIYE